MKYAAISEYEAETAWMDFSRLYNEMQDLYIRMKALGADYDPKYTIASKKFKARFIPLYNSTMIIQQWIAETREIPTGQAKKLEMVLRSITSLKRGPNDPKVWWEKNNDGLFFLLYTVQKWPEKTEDKVYMVNRIRIHDMVAMPPKKLDEILKVIDAATDKIKSHGFGQILYGDLSIVGQILGAKTAAWYNVANDTLQVRATGKGIDILASLKHELGHRHWFKFLSSDKQKAWRNHYLENSYKSMDMSKVPKVGDVLPEFGHTVVRIEGLKFYIDDRHFVRWEDIKRVYNWPTHYSATDAEEFYAECFRLYLDGKLQEPFLAWFEEVTR